MVDKHTELTYQLFSISLEKFSKRHDQLSAAQQDEVERIAKRKLHIEEAVLSSNESARVVTTESHLQEVMASVQERYTSTDEFYEDLDRIGLSEADFAMAVSRQLHVEAVMDYVCADTQPITDTDVSLFYYMNLGKFTHPEIRTARHILITINEDDPRNTREMAFDRISQVLRRLRSKPHRFDEQALKHSECPTAMQGGQLGKVKLGTLYPEIEKVLFALKPGECSEVVETELGFHIVRCDEVRQAGTLSLQEATPSLREKLEQRNRQQRQRQWLDAVLANQHQDLNIGEQIHD